MKKPPFQTANIEWWGDSVPEAKTFGDIYFSRDDGLSESEFVFLGGIGAPESWEKKIQYSIGETGFGTGLNFLTTWAKWRETAPKNATLNYVSVEGFPLTKDDLTKALKPFTTLTSSVTKLAPLTNELIDSYPLPYPGFHHIKLDEGRVRLTLLFGPVGTMLRELSGQFDAWYLDGFAPSKNPDMWSDEVFKQLSRLMKDTSKIATFTAAGFVKRNLEGIGFTTTKTAGFDKKRHRILAHKKATTAPKTTPKTIAIIGAGIAGCTMAHALKEKGLSPTLIDFHGKVAQEASGNPVGIIKPQLALGDDPVSRFYTLSFIHAHRFYHQLAETFDDILVGDEGTVEGVDSETISHFQKIIKALNWGDDVLSLQTNKEGKRQFHNKWGLSLCPKKATAALSKDTPIINAKVAKIEQCNNGWQLLDDKGNIIIKADAVVVANAMAASSLLPQSTLPLIPKRGQVHTIPTWDNAPTQTQGFKGYFTPKHPETHEHILGATFTDIPIDDLADEDKWRPLRGDEYLSMLARAEAAIPNISKNPPPMEGRANIRATTHDHMPVAGGVMADDALVKGRAKKPSGWEKKILAATPAIDGLYMMTGLGSKGFQTAPLLADYITSLITHEPSPLEKSIALALNPGRFKLFEMKRKK
jgi:tRNA 5-methylaminomethyl-2-thiouridine biosynthesis bifunctional protein